MEIQVYPDHEYKQACSNADKSVGEFGEIAQAKFGVGGVVISDDYNSRLATTKIPV
jgi:hypothetical protein